MLLLEHIRIYLGIMAKCGRIGIEEGYGGILFIESLQKMFFTE
jgi:hypothetical protein